MRTKLLTVFLLFGLCVLTGFATAAPVEKAQVIIGFTNAPDAALIHAHGGTIKYEYNIIQAIACELPVQAIEALQKNKDIEYIETDAQAWAQGETMDWGVNRIESDLVWDTDNNLAVDSGAPSGAGVKVAVIDTGIDYSHEDLNVAGGVSFVDYTTSYLDDHSHGTHVAGTIAALDNEIGMIGTAPDVELYAVKVLDNYGSGSYSDIIAGIEWAVENDIDIISMSLGGSSEYSYLKQACDNAYNAGVLIVAAAGNSGTYDGSGDTVLYPAKYDSVIAVAATDSGNNRAYYSSTGPAVEIAAPGTSIRSTVPLDGYSYKSGTSMACPHVSGVAALVKSANPGLTNTEIRSILTATAYDLGLDATLVGSGLVRADLAVAAAGEPIQPTPTPTPAPAPEPVAAFLATPLIGEAPLPVTFTDESQNAVKWSWNFGDGSTSTAQNPAYTYLNSGTYTVTLTVTNTDGATDTATAAITATDAEPSPTPTPSPTPAPVPAPEASFSATPVTGEAPLPVTFTDYSLNAESWYWDFGDGSSVSAQNTAHTYAAAGTYTATLTVTGTDGTTDSATAIITVTETENEMPPIASFIASPAAIKIGTKVRFTDLSADADGWITSWSWKFGDGSYSNEQNPKHAFETAGTFSVTLTVTDNDGNTASTDMPLVVEGKTVGKPKK